MDRSSCEKHACAVDAFALRGTALLVPGDMLQNMQFQSQGMSRLVLVVVGALALGLPHGADAACTPCEDACREEEAKNGRRFTVQRVIWRQMHVRICRLTVEEPSLSCPSCSCAAGTAARILGEGVVGTTGHVPTSRAAATTRRDRNPVGRGARRIVMFACTHAGTCMAS